MVPIVHLLCKDIIRVDPTQDVKHFQESILNSFTNCILLHFHVANLVGTQSCQLWHYNVVVP